MQNEYCMQIRNENLMDIKKKKIKKQTFFFVITRTDYSVLRGYPPSGYNIGPPFTHLFSRKV